MASLKDLRNRIASVKATQKITKAMQMVAAAKLRRAQEAAEAARPYSQRMGAVLANIAEAVGGGGDAPALMTGTGKDDTHLLVVCTAERGLCGGFNSQIARFARDHIRKLQGQGKTVKIICVGKKGFDILRRDFASLIIERVDLREAKTLGFVHADEIARKIIHLFDEGGFDVCTLFYSEFKSVISQIPTALQIIPAAAWSHPASRRRPAATPSTNTSRSRARSCPISSRATSRCRSSARCSRTRPARWAPR